MVRRLGGGLVVVVAARRRGLRLLVDMDRRPHTLVDDDRRLVVGGGSLDVNGIGVAGGLVLRPRLGPRLVGRWLLLLIAWLGLLVVGRLRGGGIVGLFRGREEGALIWCDFLSTNKVSLIAQTQAWVQDSLLTGPSPY